MNLNSLLFTVSMVLLTGSIASGQSKFCAKGATVSVGGETELSFLIEDLGDSKVYRFSSRPLVNAYGYLITDEENTILQVSKTNLIDLATLGAGQFRIWSFSYIGDILATPGENAAAIELASFCYGLSKNYVAVEIVDPSVPQECIEAEFPTVAKAIGRNNLLQILQRGLENADLGPALIVEGPLTVFAPVNNAFAKLPNEELDALFSNANGDLESFMLNHVVAGCYTAADLADGQVLTSVAGGELQVAISEAGVTINGARVVQINIGAENGVVHLLDSVLKP